MRKRKRRMQSAGMCLLAIVSMSIALAGCGTNNSQIFSSSGSNLFNTPSAAKQANASVPEPSPGPGPDVDCPSVAIRNGAATLTITNSPKSAEPEALAVRYQGSILRTARECHVNAGVMTMKIGVEGRMITGPAGGPGLVDVPLRIAVVQEGIAPKTITSKLGHETVTIGDGADHVNFMHIDPEISFPLPQPVADIDKYVVYVGFDPLGAKAEKKKPAVKPRHGRKPTPRQS